MNTADYAAKLALDWGEDNHAFVLQMQGGSREKGTIPAYAEVFHRWLDELGKRCAGRPIAVVVEAGRNAVVHALFEHPSLTVFPVHPAASKRFRKALIPSGAKDDIPDADLLLTLFEHHHDLLRPLIVDTQATRRLELLVIARRDAVDLRTLLSNQLNSALKTYFPQALDLFGDEIYTPLPLDFLTRWPSLATAQAARPATLRQFYHAHNSRRPALIEERLAVLHTTRPLTTDDAVIEVGILHTRMLVAQLRPLQKAIESFEERIAEAFAAHPDRALFCNLPAAGPALAPRLLVAFGSNRARYPSASSLQKYAGVAPVREKSGRQMWTHWRWNCPKFLRQSFVEWAGCTIPKVAWAKTYYRRQEARGVGHQAILRGLAFKWIRILWRCWQDRVPYDENRYIEALTRHHSPDLGPCLFSR
ncbi:MAG: transposase [Opitutaceae bacterium]|nr:transposase [Opitutaceae bacterium]